MREVAVLFARADSVYKTLPGCDVWDEARDARNWPGGAPIVAHPPCRAWGSLKTKAKPVAGEKELALLAVAWIREFGGVLEHPWQSDLRTFPDMPRPGARDAFGGWILPIRQHSFGHLAIKRTMLYVVGCAPHEIPPLPLVLGEASHTVGLFSGRDRENCKPGLPKSEFDKTPPALAEWLVELARRCCTQLETA